MGLAGTFLSMASHNRRVASVHSFLGAPYMPLKEMTWPRHETIASQPLTCSAICSSLKSRMLASITAMFWLPRTAAGNLSRDRTMTRTLCLLLRSCSTSGPPVFPVAPRHQYGHSHCSFRSPASRLRLEAARNAFRFGDVGQPNQRSGRQGVGLAARGESPPAFDQRCILAAGVAPLSNTGGILNRRALSARVGSRSDPTRPVLLCRSASADRPTRLARISAGPGS